MPQRGDRNAPVAVVGSGPNGLAAAVTLADRGLPVRVYEANPTAGGGVRTGPLTLPGFQHDVCSTAHPMGLASPFFRALDPRLNVRWIHPGRPLAHPFDDGTAAILDRSIHFTAESLDTRDARAYRSLLEPFVEEWEALFEEVLAPPLHLPRRPILWARFGLRALRAARSLAESEFAGPRARALFAGLAAHALEPLETPPTAGVALMLAIAGHAVGWPFAGGGSGRIAGALVERLIGAGGELHTSARIDSIDQLSGARAILLDLTPAQILRVASGAFSGAYRRQLQRYEYGPGSFKLDWALSEPIPWTAAECHTAGTVHLGGSLEEIADAARAPSEGRISPRPFVLLTQPTLFDPSRAPAGRHVAWAYVHVPHGSGADCVERVERQVERFAPGFRDTILARHSASARSLEEANANLVGGDINGGSQGLRQTFFRPAIRWNPYRTPDSRIFLCSSSTPPGGGVHGMCGHLAARTALRRWTD